MPTKRIKKGILLSVIIPVYNVEKYIRKCVDSVLESFEFCKDCVEIIIVNDGSTDSSVECVRDYIDSNLVELIEQENKGLGEARNVGLTYATGEYVWFIDSDDYIYSEEIRELYAIVKSGRYDMIVVDGCYVSETFEYLESFVGFSKNDFTKKQMFLELPAAWNKVCRRNIWLDDNIRYPSGMWFEDFAIIPFVISKCDSFYHYNRNVYAYMQRSGSIMKSSKLDRYLEIITAYEYLSMRMDDIYKEELQFLMVWHILLTTSKRILQVSDRYDLVGVLEEYVKDVVFRDNIYYGSLRLYDKVLYSCLKNHKFVISRIIIRCGLLVKKILKRSIL